MLTPFGLWQRGAIALTSETLLLPVPMQQVQQPACRSAAKANRGSFLTPAEVRSAFESTGDLITDTKGGHINIAKPRVNLGNAINTVPPGLGCGNAIPLSLNLPYNGTTIGASSNVNSYHCANWDVSGPEKVHRITTTVAGNIRATLTNLSADLDVFILTACDPSSCVAVGDNHTVYPNAPPGTYYIVVDGCNGASGSYTLTVDMCTIPGNPPSMIFPTSDDDGSYTVSWSSVSGASAYELQRATNTGFADAITIYYGPATSYNESGLPNGNYWYRVRASSTCGSPGWITGGPVSVCFVPSPPILLSPSNGATAISITPTLDWSDVRGATSYDVQICGDSNCSTVVRSAYALVNSQWAVLPAFNTWMACYWRARANNGCGASWSGAWSFTTVVSAAFSIWSPGVTVGPDAGATAVYELGVKFRADLNGYITGIRFYKYPGNTGTHTGSLWKTDGTRLGQVTFSNETASGWQEAHFATPIPITANTTYIASYYCSEWPHCLQPELLYFGGGR